MGKKTEKQKNIMVLDRRKINKNEGKKAARKKNNCFNENNDIKM